MSQVLRKRAIGILTAGMSTRAVAHELNVHFSTISHLQRRFGEFGSTNRLREAHLHRGLDLTEVRHRKRLEWENAHIRWHLALWRGVLFTDESRFSLYRADSVYGVVWVSGLLMSTLWIEWPMGWVGLWYGQAYVMDNEHRCILLMAFWMHRDTVTRAWGPLLCHSSTTITSCCNMIMYGPMLQGLVHNFWKLKTSQFLHGQHIHRTACSISCQYPATSHSHWRGVDQHSTGHNQQPEQLYAKEMCCTAWGKWWSHQILTGFRTPPNTVKLYILVWPFIVDSLRHTCAIIMLSNQHLDMPHLWGGWIISAKEKCSLTQI